MQVNVKYTLSVLLWGFGGAGCCRALEGGNIVHRSTKAPVQGVWRWVICFNILSRVCSDHGCGRLQGSAPWMALQSQGPQWFWDLFSSIFRTRTPWPQVWDDSCTKWRGWIDFLVPRTNRILSPLVEKLRHLFSWTFKNAFHYTSILEKYILGCFLIIHNHSQFCYVG